MFEYTRRWTSKGVTKQQVRYGITSLPADVSDAAQLAALKRGHWQMVWTRLGAGGIIT